MPRRRRSLRRIVASAGIALLSVELACFAGGRFLAKAGFLYDPPRNEDYDHYRSDRDPVTGWPPASSVGHGDYDRAGSRFVPSFPDPSLPSAIALFGDSFTWGGGVRPEEAFGNVLAELVKRRVANYRIGR